MLGALLLGAPLPAAAQDRPDESQPTEERSDASPASLGDRWEFVAAPYLLFPHMSGTLNLRGIRAEVDASPGDIFSRLQFGAMLFLEAHSSLWAVSVDGLYMNLSETAGRGLAEVGARQCMVELTGYRRLVPWLEVLAGARLNILGGDIELLPTGGPIFLRVDQTRAWVDPIAGARASVAAGRRWLFVLRADVGGFGVGSEFAWQIYPLASYRVSKLFGVAAGYRVLSMNYETGRGEDLFEYDVTTFGPQIGVSFHF